MSTHLEDSFCGFCALQLRNVCGLLNLLGGRGRGRGRSSTDGFARTSLVDVSLVEEAGEQHKVRKVHQQRQFDVLLAHVALLTVLLQLQKKKDKRSVQSPLLHPEAGIFLKTKTIFFTVTNIPSECCCIILLGGSLHLHGKLMGNPKKETDDQGKTRRNRSATGRPYGCALWHTTIRPEPRSLSDSVKVWPSSSQLTNCTQTITTNHLGPDE